MTNTSIYWCTGSVEERIKIEVEVEVCLGEDSGYSWIERPFSNNLYENKIEKLKKPDTATKQPIFKRFMNIFFKHKEDIELEQKTDFRSYHECSKQNVSPVEFAETKLYHETTTSGYYERCASPKIYAKTNSVQKTSIHRQYQAHERNTGDPEIRGRRTLQAETTSAGHHEIYERCAFSKNCTKEKGLHNTVSGIQQQSHETLTTREYFFSAVCEKLEKVKRDQEVRKNLGNCLKDFRPYSSCPEKQQRRKSQKQMKQDRKLSMQHRVHWEDHVLQENKTTQNCRQSRIYHTENFNKESYGCLSDTSQRENRPPNTNKRYSYIFQNENKCRQRNDRSSDSASPEKTRSNRCRKRSSTQAYTVVGFSYGAHSIPFMTRLQGNKITLGQFKSLINKKQKYRFFFKTYRSDFGTNIVFEEITSDNDVLPLWDGKIYAIVEKM